ncbi:MAG: hypothetical protein AAGA93_11910 [Actinomycetota bacterium]
MEPVGSVLRNLDNAEERVFDRLDDALDALQAPFVTDGQALAGLTSGDEPSDGTPIAVGTGPDGADGSSIVGCRSDVIAGPAATR